ncbi:hypothetical protein [Chitinophaga cymbidii]|uniref:Uncharacterized protein n=1 Tax=Chitinophaga cymbidii TaxID=1096750 RepID=A0A512RK80_9BACT|nr:hypothetical protein [Chitinophaga cymbidii]GEP96123.1 hypothetical protein CCY01nite_23830 [Chitinophaga cymbidii]
MKSITFLLACATLFVIFFLYIFLAKPSRKQAFAALRNPDTVWQSIRTADSLFVTNVYLPDLVNNGMVQLNGDAADSTGSLISFTPQAFPFFLPTSEQEKADGIQHIFIAEAVLVSVIKVQRQFGSDEVSVECVVEYRNLSPFADLSKMRDGERDTVWQWLYKSDGVWKANQNRFH